SSSSPSWSPPPRDCPRSSSAWEHAMSPPEPATAGTVGRREDSRPEPGRTRVLTSVYNALQVLEHLVEARESGVSEIGRELGMTVGTAHRLVTTLVDAGFAAQNPDNRRYRPGP